MKKWVVIGILNAIVLAVSGGILIGCLVYALRMM